jgi:aspartyl-tRNA(Asn)/glutamyl-tRNA(Gln) amidotransferase subunit A
MSTPLHSLTLVELRRRLVAREISPVDIVNALQARAEAVDGRVHAYTWTDWDAAKAEAAKADLSRPLGGIPVGIKDVLNVKGQPCTCSSKILRGYVAPYDAGAIEKLREAGAIPCGRLNMDEFAMGSSTENSADGPTRNPWDLERIPGGSSGGSAAAVAADEAIVTLGSDTGGSIRQPAALCGCVGIKPTYGRVSRYGLVAFASSLDQIGPFGKTVEDAARVLEAISGRDTRDCTSLDKPVEPFDFGSEPSVRGMRLGVPKEYFIEGMDAGIAAATRAAIDKLAGLGAEIVEVSLPHTEYAVASYYIIAPAEASANLARFDGVRYGARVKDGKDVLDVYGRTRANGFGAEVKRRILLGTYVLSHGYYDAYYLKAQKVRTLIRQDFDAAFTKCDALLTPTSPVPAFKLGERVDDPLQMYLADVFTIAVNMAGICGMSLPCGMVASDTGTQLPVGLQIIGPAFGESTLVRVGRAYEAATAWHQQRPTL